MSKRIIALALCAGMLLLGGCASHDEAGLAVGMPAKQMADRRLILHPPPSRHSPKIQGHLLRNCLMTARCSCKTLMDMAGDISTPLVIM